MFGNRLRRMRKYLLWSVLGLAWVGGIAQAQTPPKEDVNARLERQEREIQELKAMLLKSGLRPVNAEDAKADEKSVKKIVDGYLNEKDKQKVAADAAAKQKIEDEGFKVGSDLKLNARWDYFGGFIVETPNKDFTFHVGARFQFDSVWFTQSPGLVPAAQFGEMQDGVFFRRSRINFNGKFWEVFEYNMEFLLEQVKEGIVQFDDCYVGMRDIPLLGTIRVGHMHIPQGLEGDQYSSSKAMTFLEKGLHTDAFYENQAPGILVTNSIADQRMTWAVMGYRQELAFHNFDGADFGDGKYGYMGRVTALPIYENDGNRLLHLGASATWRKAEFPDPGLTGPGLVRFRSRPQLRDAIGDYGNNVLSGNASRMVDTGNLVADSTVVIGTELLWICGPFSVQAEWAYAEASNVVAADTVGNRSFHGGYVQASYFLTGEHRTYDRRLAKLDPNYFTGPATNFWLTHDEDGHWLVGRGAWEIAARYSYLNLNDGPVNGGVMNGYELALNWYMNPNVKVQFEYMSDNRWSMKPGLLSGVVQGVGTRVQITY